MWTMFGTCCHMSHTTRESPHRPPVSPPFLEAAPELSQRMLQVGGGQLLAPNLQQEGGWARGRAVCGGLTQVDDRTGLAVEERIAKGVSLLLPPLRPKLCDTSMMSKGKACRMGLAVAGAMAR